MRHPRTYITLATLLLTLTVALAACGSQGYAPPLGKNAHATLTGAFSGTATFTPAYATHIVTYYEGKALPYASATLPVELRNDSCDGPILANLTKASDPASAPTTTPLAGATSTTQSESAQSTVVQVDPQGGVDVSLPQSMSLWVTVRAKANDPNAAILACGQPLSGRRQYFDLYPPTEGSNGMALGLALMEPIVATQVKIALNQSTDAPVAWAVRADACEGAPVAGGQIAAGATQTTGYIFKPLDSHWRLTLTPGSGAPSCYTLG